MYTSNKEINISITVIFYSIIPKVNSGGTRHGQKRMVNDDEEERDGENDHQQRPPEPKRGRPRRGRGQRGRVSIKEKANVTLQL